LAIHMVALPKNRISGRVIPLSDGRLLNQTDTGTSPMKSRFETRTVAKNGKPRPTLSMRQRTKPTWRRLATMKHGLWLTVAFVASFAACTSDKKVEPMAAQEAEISDPCVTPPVAAHYADVAPIFVAHCDKCHNATLSENAKAQAVFESSGYPFATDRPDTLLKDLRHMFEVREALSAEQRCLGLAWIAAGALDDSGQPPPWTPLE